MYNLLFTSVGRRVSLLKNFKNSLGLNCKIITTDYSPSAPANFLADKYYLTPKITDPNYIDIIINICKKENIHAITSLIDPEISLLAHNKKRFLDLGIIPLVPNEITAEECFDKYKMYEKLKKYNINTAKTFLNINDFLIDYANNSINFPVFIKPRTGSGSIGAQKVISLDELKLALQDKRFEYIIQEFMDGEDCDADIYIDSISHRVVSIFSKKKIETKIGGASKTISFKDPNLFEFIKMLVGKFEFSGPINVDFFYRNGAYYLSEINPRFGGGYLHAYGSGVDFPKLIARNIDGFPNDIKIGDYDEGTVMLMYDAVIMTTLDKIKQSNRMIDLR